MLERRLKKPRNNSNRLQNWDYRWQAAYFITICTENRNHYFGEIKNGKMYLSNIGVLADIFWHEITHHTKNVKLSAFVVMPNHIHGIIELTENTISDNKIMNRIDIQSSGIVDVMGVLGTVGTNNDNYNIDTVGTVGTVGIVGTGHALPLQYQHQQISENETKTIGQQRFQNIGKNSISSIIGSYKSAVTKHARRLGYEFGWQTRFYDNVIRDSVAYDTISNYIRLNVSKWESDRFHDE